MKEIYLTLSQVIISNKRYFATVSSILTLLFAQGVLIAQNNAPAVEWNYSTPSTVAGFGLDDNWAHSIIQTSDGNFVACGFSDMYNTSTNQATGFRHPSVLKYNPGRTVVWEKIPTFQSNPQVPIANTGRGGFSDLFETTESGTKYIYACGAISRTGTTNERIAVIAKFRLDNGQLIYFAEHALGTNAYFARMLPYPTATNPTSIFAAGFVALSGQNQKGSVIKLNPSNGSIVTSFGSGGFIQYSDAAPNSARETQFKDISLDGTANNGLLLTGSIRVSGAWPNQPVRDAWVLRINSSGTEIWRKTITEATTTGYVDLNQLTEIPFCTGSPAPTTTETSNEEGWAITVMPDGNIAMLARFDWIEISAVPGTNIPPLVGNTPNANDCWAPTPSAADGCWPFNTEQYYDSDLALVKMSITNGNLLYSRDVGRSVAVDNWADMVKSGNDIYIVASAFVPDNNANIYNEKIQGSVIKVTDQAAVIVPNFTTRWRKDSDVQLSFEFCPFGLCLAQDGGVVICGNNHCNGDDYEFIKFAPDCQANATFNTPSSTINSGQTLTWSTSKTVNGTIRVKSGGHLIIQGATTTVSFANSYLTNDWYKLRDGLGTPSKIIVEEGGKLTLDGCTLSGLNGCSRDWMWEGIEVYGKPNFSPSTTNQGIVIMKNNAIISNAYKGIVAGDSYYDAQGRSASGGTKGGGLIQCANPVGSTVDHFVNCRRSVWFAPYTYTGSGYNAPAVYFNHTNFKVNASNYANDANLVDANGVGLGFAFMFSSWNRDHITCANTSFKNTTSLLGLPETSRGIGVDGYDAKFTLNSCRFDQLYRGVNVSYGVGVTDRLTMNLCTLTNTRHNIEVLGGSFHNIQNCNVNSLPASLVNDPSYGIKLNGSTNLYCAGNTFDGTANAILGIVTENSGTNASDFYNNIFTQVDFGVQTQQFNTGLQIRCNSFTGNNNAWSINPQSAGTGQLSPQGVCDAQFNQAGNVFNDPICTTIGSSEIHIKSNVPFAYRSRNSASFPLELPTCVTQPNITVTVDNCTPLQTKNTSCDPNQGGCVGCKLGQSITESKIEQSVWIEQMTANHEIGKLIDEGQSAEIPNLIRKAFPKDKVLLVSTLLNMQKFKEAKTEIEALSSKDEKVLLEIMCALTEKGQRRLSDDQQTQLLELVKRESLIRYQAMAILEQHTSLRFNRPIESWEKSGKKDYVTERNEVKTLVNQTDEISVFPNPARDLITVQSISNPIQSLCLIDLMGRKLLNEYVNDFEQSLHVDQLPTGVYLLQVACSGNFTTYKVVIQK
jgi:Secretion system C-terminal sorting domain